MKISHVAAALNMSERTVRAWADAGKLAMLPTPPRCTRYVDARELLRLEGEGWPVSWEVLLSLVPL